MERFTISKSEKQTIFEIYRACRLCGAGGGYRMPIIQNIVDLDDSNVELKQKIQDCLQLEVRSDDRMPPLICELCVDKVNDFYKFMQLARQTDTRTRTKLGLPSQTVRRGHKVESDNKDSFLGDTEPEQDKPVAKKGKAGPKCSKKKEEEPDNIKEELIVPSPRESRSSSLNRPSKSSKPATQPSRVQPSTPKVTQQANATSSQPRSQPSKTTKVTQVTHGKNSGNEKKVQEKDLQEIEIKRNNRLISRKELQNLLEDNASFDDNSLLIPRAQKRLRENEIPKPLIIPKRSKPTPKEPVKVDPPKEPTPPPPRPKPRPKSKQEPKHVPTPLKVPKKAKPDETPPPPKVEPPKTFNCVVCNMPLKTVQAVTNHTRHHVPNYTKPQNACNPCGKWFATTEEANTHHRYHRAATFPYHCRRCFDDYSTLPEYDLHITNNKCVPWETVPDVKCEECWKTFPTDNLRRAHKCAGIDARPGGKCSNCSRTYATSKSLKKHESTCNQRRKRDLIADPDVLRRLKPMQVRISRCDDLVAATGECVDVSAVKPNYGLDRQYLYPYMKYKVKIKSTNKGRPKCKRERYTHWDSEASDDDGTKVHKLSTLCIKKLFSKNLIGKVPKKRRKIENEESNDFGSINNDISSILSSLGDTEDIENSARNELLIASLNDIIGVPQEGYENVVSNENYVTNDSNATSDEKNEITNQIVTGNDAENRYTGNDDVSMNENDGDTALTDNSVINENEKQGNAESVSKTDDVDDVNNSAFAEKSEISDENYTQANAEDAGKDNVISNDNDVNLNDCNTVQGEKCEISNQNDAEESSKHTESYNVDGNENVKPVFSENIDVLNQNDQYIAEDTGNEDAERNYVNTNESELNENEKSDDISNVRVMGNEPVVSKENDNISTNNSEDESEIAFDESMHDKTVSGEVFCSKISDISTKPQLEDSEHNDIENDCDNEVTNQQQLINNIENNSENATESRLDSELVNTIGNDEESNKDGINSGDLETHIAALVDNENNATVNGINSHENETEQNSSKTDETESEKMEVNNVNTKESPIKHSIENIIGDTDKNPQSYIEEVISSIEKIIMKNPTTEKQPEKVNGEIKDDIEDQNLLDAIDAQIGEERKSDSDKITLEDLLTREDPPMELDDISDEDFDFDA